MVRKERPYCRTLRFLPESGPLVVFLALLFGLYGGSPFLLSVIFGWDPLPTFSLFFGIVCIPLIICIFWAARTVSRARASLRNRSPIELDDFHTALCKEGTYRLDVTSAIRDTLGFVHGVEPSKVHSLDALRLLCYGGDQPPPYQFEVILGIANRLGVVLSEAEVDRIGQQVYRNAKTVADLVAIVHQETKLILSRC
jgi:hypothetical protein